MLASFLASNYAFYAQNQGFAPGIIYSNYVNPQQYIGHSMEIPLEGKKTGLNGHAPHSEVFVKREKEKKACPNSSDVKFSIARILGETSTDTKDIHELEDDVISEPTSDVTEDNVQYSWLQCTRYKPPKLQRIRKRDNSRKRKIGRNPRVPFTQQQVAALEQKFFRTHYLSSMDVAELSSVLNLTETRVKIWFQNRRARERREREAKQRENLVEKTITGRATDQRTWTMTNQQSASIRQYHETLNIGQSAFKPVSLQYRKT